MLDDELDKKIKATKEENEKLQQEIDKLKQETENRERNLALQEQARKEKADKQATQANKNASFGHLSDSKNELTNESISLRSEMSISLECKQLEKIEAALTNPFFVEKSLQTPQHQFMLIQEARKRGKISKSVCQRLIEPRMSALPERVKWVEEKNDFEENITREADNLELYQNALQAQIIDTNDASYKTCQAKFIARINGINKEIPPEDRLEELRVQVGALPLNKPDCSTSSVAGEHSEDEILFQLLEQLASVEQSPSKEIEEPVIRENPNNDVDSDYASQEELAISTKVAMNEDGEKVKKTYDCLQFGDYEALLITYYIPESRETKLCLNELQPHTLKKIMQATLAVKSSLSPIEKANQDMQYMEKMKAAFIQAERKFDDRKDQGNLVSIEPDSIIVDFEKKIKEIQQTHDKTKEKDCKLQGPELIQAYFYCLHKKLSSLLANRLKEHGFGRKFDSKYRKLADKLIAANNINRDTHFEKLVSTINKSTDFNKNKSKAEAIEALSRYKKGITFFNDVEKFVESHADKDLSEFNVYEKNIVCKI